MTGVATQNADRRYYGDVGPAGSARAIRGRTDLPPSVRPLRARRRTSNALTDQNDTPLLPKVAEGDKEAVRACLERYGGLVWSLARRMSPDRHAAEDAVQEIFLEVWRVAGRYDASVASETAFIAMIARRRLIDRVRKAGRRAPETALVEAAAESGSPPGPESTGGNLENAESLSLAREVLGELSEDQQRVLQLSLMYGLSHDKIAQSTGMPLGTVKTHARRGLLKARQILADRQRLQGSAGGAGGEVES